MWKCIFNLLTLQCCLHRIAKKEEIAAKKILLASVEAEKKSRQGESATATVTEQKSKPPQPSSSQSSIALIKMRMPNGEVHAPVF